MSSIATSSIFSEDETTEAEEEWDDYFRENVPYYDSWLHRTPKLNPAMSNRWSVTFKLLAICAVVHFSFFTGQFLVQSTSFAFEMMAGSGQDLVFIEQTFNVWTSIKQAWRDAKTYHDSSMITIAVVIFITSIIVPHLKLILAMYIWLIPDMKHSVRRNYTKLLDAIGRWNHFDVILCNYLVAMCRYKADISNIIVMETYVYIMAGLYWYCCGVIVSQLIGNFVVLKLYSLEDREEPPARRLFNGQPSGQRYTLSKEARVGYGGGCASALMFFLPVLMLINIVVYWAAIWTWAFKVDVRVPRYFAPCSEELYSVMGTTWMLLTNQSMPLKYKHDLIFKAGEWFVAWTVLVFLFFAPSIRLLLQLIMWFVPMTKESHVVCQRWHEVAMDWSCLDVSIWSAYMCFTMSKSVTETYLPCGDCFAVIITPIGGFYLCILSVFISYLVNYLVLAAIDKITEAKPEDTQPLLAGSKPSKLGSYSASCGTDCECANCTRDDLRRQGTGSLDLYAQETPQDARKQAITEARKHKLERSREKVRKSGERSRSPSDYPGTVPRPSPRL